MAELVLSARERQALKGRAHALDPVVLLGAGGLTPAVMGEIDRALSAHELIKVRVPGDERAAREAVYQRVAEELSAARVQSIGKLLVFFRPAPEKVDDATVGPAARPDRPAGKRPRSKAPPPLPKKAAGNRPARPTRDEIRRERAQAPRRAPGKTTARSGKKVGPTVRRGR